MPYNTRRKSLSLPSLGIHVPVTHAARAAAAQRNSAASSPSTPSTSSATAPAPTNMPSVREDQQSQHPPSKKVKRSHSGDDDASMSSNSPLPASKRIRDAAIKLEQTPPPSPGRSRNASVEMEEADGPITMKTVDLEGINDEIVEAVIVQLQNTGNRPHLVKELAAILMQQLRIVQQSANPCAIISSRLSTYLKRTCWSALAPCPLAKELETVHPRRTYFYLTTCAHQPLPDPAHAAALSQLAQVRAVITPSLSSAGSGSGSEDADPDRRRELSPSPEIDLSTPDFDDMDDDVAMPSTPVGSFSARGFAANPSGSATSVHRNHRAASPPLEKDEKEFTQTADGLQKRKLSGNLLSASATLEHVVSMEVDDSGLFGGESRAMLTAVTASAFVTSPSMRPAFSLNLGKNQADGWTTLDNMLEWDRSPENIDVEELDGLLSGY